MRRPSGLKATDLTSSAPLASPRTRQTRHPTHAKTCRTIQTGLFRQTSPTQSFPQARARPHPHRAVPRARHDAAAVGLKATELTSLECPSSVITHAPDSASHTRTHEPDTPSGLEATDHTRSECPSSVASHAQDSASHTRKDLSPEPDKMRRPSGLKATPPQASPRTRQTRRPTPAQTCRPSQTRCGVWAWRWPFLEQRVDEALQSNPAARARTPSQHEEQLHAHTSKQPDARPQWGAPALVMDCEGRFMFVTAGAPRAIDARSALARPEVARAPQREKRASATQPREDLFIRAADEPRFSKKGDVEFSHFQLSEIDTLTTPRPPRANQRIQRPRPSASPL